MGGNDISKQLSEQINDVIQQSMNTVWNMNSSDIRSQIQNIQTIKIHIKGDLKCSNLSVQQAIRNDMKFVDTFTAKSTNDLKTQFESNISNKNEQTMKIARDFLAGIGASTSDENVSRVVNRVQQILNNSVTTQNLNNILHTAMNVQEQEFIVDGNLLGDVCNFNQYIQSNMVAESITNNLISNIVHDEALSRIVNENKQSMTKVSLGATALLIAAALLSLAVGYMVTKVQGSYLKIIILVVGLIALYFLLAYVFKWPPFKKEIWVSEVNAQGLSTQKCINIGPNMSDDQKQIYTRTFTTEGDCKSALDAGFGQYWGCEIGPDGLNTGQAAQYKDPVNGPFKSKEDAETRIRQGLFCRISYECQKDSNGFNVSPAACIPKNQQDLPPNATLRTQTSCMDNSPYDCRQWWVVRNKTCEQLAGEPFSGTSYKTRDECEKSK